MPELIVVMNCNDLHHPGERRGGVVGKGRENVISKELEGLPLLDNVQA